jgi:hypothetical protein
MLFFEQIKLKDSKATNLLFIISFLNAKSISKFLLQVEISNSLNLINALTTLKAFALVTFNKIDNDFNMYEMI